MDGITRTPVENSVQFSRLHDQYKSKLLDDSRLTKAADLATQQRLLLESHAPDSWKEARLRGGPCKNRPLEFPRRTEFLHFFCDIIRPFHQQKSNLFGS